MAGSTFHYENNGRNLEVEGGGVQRFKSGSTLLIDPGAAISGTPGNLARSVINKTGLSIAADKLVAISGLDATSGKPTIVLADADVAAHDDVYVTTEAIANDAEGVVYQMALSAADLNTNSASAAGDPVYLSTTAGGFAHTAPTGATARVQPAGFVVVKSATVGQILWLIGPVRKAGSNELQGQILDGTQVANVATDNLAGAVPVVHFFTIANQASGNIDYALRDKTRILDAWIIKGAAGHATEDTILLQNVTTPITAALVMANVANALKRFVTLEQAAATIAAGANLRAVIVRGSGGGNDTSCTLCVLGVRVA